MGSNTNILDQDSLLMLYSADELSAEQRKRVEQMLSEDPSLRARLDEMLSAQEATRELFKAADAKTPLPAPVSSSVLRVCRAIQQWQVDRLARPAAHPRERRKLGWLYASASVAAALIVTVFVLWSRVDDGKNDHIAELAHQIEQQDDSKTADKPAEDQVADYTPTGGESDRQLTRAEGDMYTLSTLTDSLRPTDETVTP